MPTCRPLTASVAVPDVSAHDEFGPGCVRAGRINHVYNPGWAERPV